MEILKDTPRRQPESSKATVDQDGVLLGSSKAVPPSQKPMDWSDHDNVVAVRHVDAVVEFREALVTAGLVPPEEIHADGKLRRFSSNGERGDDSGWYVLHGDGIPAGCFGDWRTQFRQKWRADIGRPLTASEEWALKVKAAAMSRARKEEETLRQRDAATKAAGMWGLAQPAANDHPYLARKGVRAVSTLRELPAVRVKEILGYRPKSKNEALAGRVLIVPVATGGRITTAELIDEAGRKSAIWGGAKAGGYWAAHPLPQGDGLGLVMTIGEGVATVLSVREATGHLAVAALSATHLLSVSKSLSKRYPAATFIVLADLLKATGEPDPHAIQAARAVGGRLALPDFGADRPKGATDFNDMLAHRGPEAVERVLRNAPLLVTVGQQSESENVTSTGADGWPEPLPLVAKVEPAPYPLDALPDTIRAAVFEVQGFTKAPVAMVVSSALAAVSLAVQAHVDVKRAERLTGPTGLSLLTIADSGERKTTCDGFFTTSIREYQERQVEEGKPKQLDYRAKRAAWDAKRAGLVEAIKQGAKKGADTSDKERSLRDLEREEPNPPRVPGLLRGDDTPENLAWVLSREWPSAGVISAEGGIIFGAYGMGRDSIMRNLALLNILWDGGALTVGRRTSESFTLRGARLTLGLQVQEATLRSFLDRSDGLARGTGFLSRFLVAWPESTQGYRPFTDPPASWPALAKFNQHIAKILDDPAPISDEGALSPAVLMLDPEAKAAWVVVHDAIECELRTGGELQDVRDVASKAADNVARLAALFHRFCSRNSSFSGSGSIRTAEIESASRIVAWHLNESRRFFGELALPAELANVARLDSWLIQYCKRGGTNIVSTRKVQQFGPSGLRDKPLIESAVAELAELCRARLVIKGRSRSIGVNPALLIEGGEE